MIDFQQWFEDYQDLSIEFSWRGKGDDRKICTAEDLFQAFKERLIAELNLEESELLMKMKLKSL